MKILYTSVGMSDTRAEMQELLDHCRGLPEIPESLFRRLELIVQKLDGPFDIHEVPTKPLHHTPKPIARVTPSPFHAEEKTKK